MADRELRERARAALTDGSADARQRAEAAAARAGQAYLSASEFAAAIGVTTETVRRWVRDNLLEPAGYTPTSRLRFSPDQIAQCLGGPPPARGEERRKGKDPRIEDAKRAMRLMRDAI